MKIKRSVYLVVFSFSALFINLSSSQAQRVVSDGVKIFEAEKATARLVKIEELTKETMARISSVDASLHEVLEGVITKRFKRFGKNVMNHYIDGDLKEERVSIALDSLKEMLIQKYNSEKGKIRLKKLSATFSAGHDRHEHSQENTGIRGPGDPCTNPNAELCNFNSWETYAGEVPYPAPGPFSYTNVQPMPPSGTWTGAVTYNNGGSFADQHYVVTGGNDPQGGFPMVNPDGGSCSFMLGDYTSSGYGAASILQTFLVSSTNAIFTYSYAVVLEDPASHTVAEKPYFRVRMYDAGGNPIACAANEAYGGDGQPGWTLVTGLYQYKPWTTVFIPLTNYIGQNVTIEFVVGDCAQGGHYGYAYIEASCNPITLLQGGQSPCSASATLTAPPGAASYLWTPGGQTTQSITVTTSGTYGVTVTPVTGSACSIFLDTVITITLNPPTANFSSNAPQCQGTPINFTDLSNPNGSTFTSWVWDFGDGGSSTLQNPSHNYLTAGTYNVTLTVTTAGGCTENITIPITVTSGTPPIINPAGPFCSQDPVFTLTANAPGGTWSASCGACINATTGAFNPSLATLGNNTITYTISGACGGTDNETVIIQAVDLVAATATNVSCFGLCDGGISITANGATQYSINNGATFQASNTFSGLCPGTYNLMVQSAGGCSDIGTATILEPVVLTAPTSLVNETCFGACNGSGSVNPAGGVVPYSYSWTNGATTSTISSLCTGNYTVMVTDNNGCQATGNVAIAGPAAVSINNIATTNEACPGDCSGTLTITASGATQYSINGQPFQASSNFINLCAGAYTVTVQDANGCAATGNTSISSPSAVNLVPGAGSTICIGQTATVSASATGGTAPYTFVWNQGLPNGTPHTVNPTTTTVYSVFVQDGNGCPTPAQNITVTVNPPLNVVALSNQSICPGQSATITATATGGNGGPYTYVWDDGAGITFTGQTQTVSPAVTTTYTVTATDNCGTPDTTDQVTITINPLPVVTFTANTLQGCTPLQVAFTNTTNPSLSASCAWDFGDGSISNNCITTQSFINPGCYTITLTVTSPAGCQATAAVPNMICVYPYPDAEFTASPQPTTVMNTQITFENLSLGAVSYSWDFAGLGSSTAATPQFTFPDENPGTYPVCLTATSNFGCVDVICHDVIIGDYFTIYVPNAFTPGGDGTNDLFTPVVDGIDENFYDFMIFDRWGEMIFRSAEVGKGWDGTHKGNQCKEDVYVWKIKVKDNEQGERREFYGHVSLLR